MKKYQEAEIEAVRLQTEVICTSFGCDLNCGGGCKKNSCTSADASPQVVCDDYGVVYPS